MNEINANELSLETALAQLESAISEAAKTSEASASQMNETLKMVAGAAIGGISAFCKKPLKLNAFVVKAVKVIRAAKALGAYRAKVIDYIEHETGVTLSEEGYEFKDSKALGAARENLKTASLTTYESKAKADEKKAKADEKKLAKQSYLDASAKQRVLLTLTSLICDVSKKDDEKSRQERAIYEKLVAFVESEIK